MNSADRSRLLKEGTGGPGPVIYWMSRDQRTEFNPAFDFAIQLAIEECRGLSVLFFLSPEFSHANQLHYSFILAGLRDVEEGCRKIGAHFEIIPGALPETPIKIFRELAPFAIVTDFDPLKIKRGWKKAVAEEVSCPLWEVDAHNIIPAWIVSDKAEYSARTFRLKQNRKIEQWFDYTPTFNGELPRTKDTSPLDWERIAAFSAGESATGCRHNCTPGYLAATACLETFLSTRIKRYEREANDPTKDVLSGLSPYFHLGQLSPHYAAQRVKAHAREHPDTIVDSFWDQLVTRRELSDNFCYYTPDYDSYTCFRTWAQETLDLHNNDRRERTYTLKEFESAETDEKLWNAAQIELLTKGRIHSYMRMYWAKKVLEWTDSYEEAFEYTTLLNDRYSLDGRDPNGYTGIAWSIGGIHDRAWRERPVFGKIRYMNQNGCKRKFDIGAYIGLNSRNTLF